MTRRFLPLLALFFAVSALAQDTTRPPRKPKTDSDPADSALVDETGRPPRKPRIAPKPSETGPEYVRCETPDGASIWIKATHLVLADPSETSLRVFVRSGGPDKHDTMLEHECAKLERADPKEKPEPQKERVGLVSDGGSGPLRMSGPRAFFQRFAKLVDGRPVFEPALERRQFRCTREGVGKTIEGYKVLSAERGDDGVLRVHMTAADSQRGLPYSLELECDELAEEPARSRPLFYACQREDGQVVRIRARDVRGVTEKNGRLEVLFRGYDPSGKDAGPVFTMDCAAVSDPAQSAEAPSEEP